MPQKTVKPLFPTFHSGAPSADSPPAVNPEPGHYLMSWGHPNGWPAIPDGRHGSLRGTGIQGLHAQTDLAAIEAWFAKKASKSINTLLSYRKEVTRLLLWAAERGQALSDLHAEDYLTYVNFLGNPQPHERWVSRGKRYGLHDPRWTPFAQPLSASSKNQAIAILSDLTKFLCDANYLAINPLALLDRRLPDIEHHAGQRNRLSTMQWDAIKTTIVTLPSPPNTQTQVRARARWLFTVLYLLGPRISELLGRFNQIQPDVIGGKRYWIWHIVGKGQKQAQIPLSDELVAEMMRMRLAFGQSALPEVDDTFPLVPRVHGDQAQPLHRSSLHTVIKEIIRTAADLLHKEGQPAEGEKLFRASAHWLRHTAASETLDLGGDLIITAELMRHSDVRTTKGYVHKDVSQLLSTLQKRSSHWDTFDPL